METDLFHVDNSLLRITEDPRTELPRSHLPCETRRWSYGPRLPWLELTARLGTELPRPFVPL